MTSFASSELQYYLEHLSEDHLMMLAYQDVTTFKHFQRTHTFDDMVVHADNSDLIRAMIARYGTLETMRADLRGQVERQEAVAAAERERDNEEGLHREFAGFMHSRPYIVAFVNRTVHHVRVEETEFHGNRVRRFRVDVCPHWFTNYFGTWWATDEPSCDKCKDMRIDLHSWQP